ARPGARRSRLRRMLLRRARSHPGASVGGDLDPVHVPHVGARPPAATSAMASTVAASTTTRATGDIAPPYHRIGARLNCSGTKATSLQLRPVTPRGAEKVVIVDDEADMCRLLAYNLEEAGFAVEAVGTGNAGLETAARIRPVVIVLDLMLPD